MKKILKGDFVPGVVAVLFGVLVMILTLTGNDMAILVAKKRGSVPGPGFFPIVCGAFTALFGAALIRRGLLRQHDYFEMSEEMRGNVKLAMGVLAGFVCFLILWKLTNHFIPLVFIYAVYLNLLFKRSWIFTLVFSVVLTAFIYYLFVSGFSVTFKV